MIRDMTLPEKRLFRELKVNISDDDLIFMATDCLAEVRVRKLLQENKEG